MQSVKLLAEKIKKQLYDVSKRQQLMEKQLEIKEIRKVNKQLKKKIGRMS